MLIKRIACLVAFATLAVAAHAGADDCKSPVVRAMNDRPETIKISKIQYFDLCDQKWRIEPVRETEVLGTSSGAHHYVDFTDNLEYVGNCGISKFKIYRAIRQDKGSSYGPSQWGDELVPDEGPNQKCNTNVRYTIHAHQ